jgi:hypothetical protein
MAEDGSMRLLFGLFLTSVRTSKLSSGLSVRSFYVAMRLGIMMKVKGQNRSDIARKAFSLDPILELWVNQFGAYVHIDFAYSSR